MRISDWSSDVCSSDLYWVFNVVDIFNRECLCSVALFRSSTVAVVAALEALRASGRLPGNLRSDNGAEFKGLKYLEWSRRHHVKRWDGRPGHPNDNWYRASLHTTPREEGFYHVESNKVTLGRRE